MPFWYRPGAAAAGGAANGCLALAHSNLFIPSTLHGSCTGETALNEDVLRKNLESIDLYISQVDGAPCASMQMHLINGADSTTYRNKNALLKIFLKGKKEEKEELQRKYPSIYSKFQRIWKFRDKHLHNELPAKYVFYLTCYELPASTRHAGKENRKMN